jgi:short-subunit dehydrogenase
MNVVITGASRGIGFALAKKFAENGFNLYLTARNDKTLMQSLEKLKGAYPDIAIHAKAFDIGDEQEAKSFGHWFLGIADKIDVLINNAGTFTPGNIWNEPTGALEKMLSVNLFSAYHVTRAIIPRMMQQKEGHIFTICSVAALSAYPNGGAYSISKFALLGFTKNLRAEMKEHNIKVTAVIPGAVYTDSWKGHVASERIMEADDIAQLIFTASRLSAQATVEEIVIRPQLGDL